MVSTVLTTPGYSLARPKADITNIIRVVATMFVFVLHGRGYVADLNQVPILNWVSSLPAWAGVWIFFFLSGYTIGLGFFKGRYNIFNADQKLSAKKLWRFYLNRLLKLAPLYFIYCILFELFSGNQYFFGNIENFLKFFTFTFNGNGGISGVGHLWYISIAMQLYLAMPFAYLLIRKIKTQKAIIASFIITLLAGLLLRNTLRHFSVDWYTWVYTFSPVNIDLVICGMLIANYMVNFSDRIQKSSILKACAVLVFVGLTVYNIEIYDSDSLHLTIYRYYLPSMYALACAVLILYFGDLNRKREAPTARMMLRYPALFFDWFSGLTYAFYVFHISVFRYTSSLLESLAFYSNGSVTFRYFVFFFSSFNITLLFAVLFTKMTSNLQSKPPIVAQHKKAEGLNET